MSTFISHAFVQLQHRRETPAKKERHTQVVSRPALSPRAQAEVAAALRGVRRLG